jgi:hypothetical protein
MPPPGASLRRRLAFCEAARPRVDALVGSLRGRARRRAHDLLLTMACVAFDVAEVVRRGGGVGRIGQPVLAALEDDVRLPQFPGSRSYWYDGERHALVGLHLGVDINRHDGRCYVIECNLGAAVRPSRRAIYDMPLDPFISEAVEIAREAGFQRIIFHANGWSAAYQEEFRVATRQSGIEVLAGGPASPGASTGRPMPSIPDPLPRNTMIVVFPSLGTPLSRFVHDKGEVARWLRESIEATPAIRHLAFVPTFDEPVIPDEPADPRWPNLVVKLANKDQGRFVAMGRFRNAEEAMAVLGMRSSRDVPAVFKVRRLDRALNRVLPRLRPIFQQFVPPEVVDGRARKVRLHVFLSPLVDRFLSAHATVAASDLPLDLQPGRLDDSGGFNVSYSGNGRQYLRLDDADERTLREVAREFGMVARTALTRKFETGPAG